MSDPREDLAYALGDPGPHGRTKRYDRAAGVIYALVEAGYFIGRADPSDLVDAGTGMLVEPPTVDGEVV